MRALVRAVAVAVAAGVGLGLPGSAAAASAGVTLHYSCPPSSAFSQPMTAQIQLDAPGSVMVGAATPATATVDVAATVGSTATWALRFDGVASVEGSGEVPATVVALEANIPTTVGLTIPRTAVPASGSMTVHATGTLPRLVFRQPGNATLTLDNGLSAHITPRDAGGNVSAAGQFDYSCALDSGQNATVLSLEITPMPAPATASATGEASSSTRAVAGGGDTTSPGPTSSALSRKGFIKMGATLRPTVKPTSDFWRIGAIGLGLAAIGVVGGLWWLRGRRRRTAG